MYRLSILQVCLLAAAMAIGSLTAQAQTYDAYGQVTVTARPHAVYHVAVARRVRHRRVVVVRRRPFSHSVAIVGGSALAGAGVGALAGGPPGAIVGALTGGIGGLIYDRKTAHRRIVVER